MSSVNTRNKANTIESAAIPAGAIVVGACLFGLAKGLSALAKAALEESKNRALPNNQRALKSVAGLRAESAPLPLTDLGSGSLEAMKTKAFRQLAAQPFLVTNKAELKTSLTAIDRAGSLTELKTAYRYATAKLESEHQQIFTTALLQAGQRAALKIGFAKIESLPSPLASTVRFAATDALGRTLITEVAAPAGGDGRIESEVVGVSDGSCVGILDRFDKALEAEGVRSLPAKRKYTGGVCELSAVRDFLARKTAPDIAEATNTKNFAPTDDARRRQRLNQKRLGQKQK